MTDLQKYVIADLARENEQLKKEVSYYKDRLRIMYNRCESWCGSTGICDVCLQKEDCDKLKNRGIR